VLKFSTEVRKCASARALKQIRKRTAAVPLLLTKSDSPAFRNCDARTEILASGHFEIIISCHVLFKTTRLCTHLFVTTLHSCL
jgi:hypothetical protein